MGNLGKLAQKKTELFGKLVKFFHIWIYCEKSNVQNGDKICTNELIKLIETKAFLSSFFGYAHISFIVCDTIERQSMPLVYEHFLLNFSILFECESMAYCLWYFNIRSRDKLSKEFLFYHLVSLNSVSSSLWLSSEFMLCYATQCTFVH